MFHGSLFMFHEFYFNQTRAVCWHTTIPRYAFPAYPLQQTSTFKYLVSINHKRCVITGEIQYKYNTLSMLLSFLCI